jgi:lysine-specific histone demethylase 1
MGNGLINKVVLCFDRVFWDGASDVFGRVARTRGNDADPSAEGWVREERGFCYLFWGLQRVVNRPVLCIVCSGTAAETLEREDDDAVVARVMGVLRRMFQGGGPRGRPRHSRARTRIPEPRRSIVTRWGCDPFSRGAYSYVSVHGSGEDYDLLARPVGRRLFFAGEATCRQHPTVAAGAVLSGLREASRVADVHGRERSVEVNALLRGPLPAGVASPFALSEGVEEEARAWRDDAWRAWRHRRLEAKRESERAATGRARRRERRSERRGERGRAGARR